MIPIVLTKLIQKTSFALNPALSIPLPPPFQLLLPTDCFHLHHVFLDTPKLASV
jgi:hypothetical protein